VSPVGGGSLAGFCMLELYLTSLAQGNRYPVIARLL